MNLTVIQRVIGILLMLFSSTMVPPMLVAAIYEDSKVLPFLVGFVGAILAGLLLWLPVRKNRADLRLRDGFVIVVLFWTVLGSFGAIPLIVSEQPSMSVAAAFFESISGLTTTGATVLTGLDELPRAILYYRQQLQWLGGLGIIVLAVAVLPMLGIGGMQLYKAETPGPIKDSKLTPRITETAKALWYIYCGLTLACAIAYWVAGMNLFDAIGHAFSTVAIGGFSTHDASMGYFDSPLIYSIAIVFMLIAGVNFGLHFLAFRNVGVKHYGKDDEFKAYIIILGTLSVIAFLGLWGAGTYYNDDGTLIHAVFQVVSFGTTTGFTSTDYSRWPIALPMMLIMVSFVGGCAGSTAGGMKVIRMVLLFKQGLREVKRLVHPNAEIPVKMGGHVVAPRVVDAVWGFFGVYIALFGVMFVIVMSTGLDQVSAFSAVAACMNNLGPGLNEVAVNFATVSDSVKWMLAFAMLLGRLEIFTLLVLFTPAFWRK